MDNFKTAFAYWEGQLQLTVLATERGQTHASTEWCASWDCFTTNNIRLTADVLAQLGWR